MDSFTFTPFFTPCGPKFCLCGVTFLGERGGAEEGGRGSQVVGAGLGSGLGTARAGGQQVGGRGICPGRSATPLHATQR